jgi:hypothetical protein
MTPRRWLAAAALLGAVACISSPVSALEVRESKARLAIDLPDTWASENRSDYVLAYPDKSFHLRMMGITSGYSSAYEAEDALLRFLGQHLKSVAVTQHTRQIEWNGYVGFETLGTGEEQSGSPAKWFAIVLNDAKDPSRGIVVLGTGTSPGYARHQPTAYAALHQVRGT